MAPVALDSAVVVAQDPGLGADVAAIWAGHPAMVIVVMEVVAPSAEAATEAVETALDVPGTVVGEVRAPAAAVSARTRAAKVPKR